MSRRYLRGGKRRVVQRCALLVLLEGSRPISAGGTRYSHLVQQTRVRRIRAALGTIASVRGADLVPFALQKVYTTIRAASHIHQGNGVRQV